MTSAAAESVERSYVIELTRLFVEDPDIDEIGIVHLDDDSEAFVLDEHKLGIAMSNIPAIHRQAKHAFFQSRKVNDVVGILNASRCMLLVCADFYTAWNARKTLISQGILSEEAEMKFSRLVLTHHAKSIDTWAHRRWVLERLCPLLGHDDVAAFLQSELALCAKLCEEFPRNYFAWSYRHCICTKLPLPLLRTELHETSRAWCDRHVSDHSAWTHRHLVLLLELPHVVEPAAVVADELAALSQLQRLYPDRDALWCHRRVLLQTMASYLGQSSPGAWSDTTGTLDAAGSEPSSDDFIHREVEFAVEIGQVSALRYAVFALEWVQKLPNFKLIPSRVTQWHADLCRQLAAADSIRASFWLGRVC